MLDSREFLAWVKPYETVLGSSILDVLLESLLELIMDGVKAALNMFLFVIK